MRLTAVGFVTNSKVATAASYAKDAATAGRSALLYRFNIPATASGWSGPVPDAAEVIEAIEAQGWRFWQMAYDDSQSKHGAVLLLFRRQ